MGVNIGKGYSIDKSMQNMNNVTVEGLYALKSIYNLLEIKKIKIDSIDILNGILYSNLNAKEILKCIK
ncbi:Glycerol-3-phosphate dehydrogenase [NAD(P)+] [compost metagenome]